MKASTLNNICQSVRNANIFSEDSLYVLHLLYIYFVRLSLGHGQKPYYFSSRLRLILSSLFFSRHVEQLNAEHMKNLAYYEEAVANAR